MHAALAHITVKKQVGGAYYFNEVVCAGLTDEDLKWLGQILAARPGMSVNDVLRKGIDVLETEILEDMETDTSTP